MTTTKIWIITILLTMLGIVFSKEIHAQETYTVAPDAVNWQCGLDETMMAQLMMDTGFVNRMTRYNDFINNTSEENRPEAGSPFIVPVVFHIILPTGTPSTTITYSQIKWQVARFNAGFLNQMNLFNGQPLGPRSVNTQIEFRLACVAQNCGAGFTNANEPGVMRYNTNSSTVLNQSVLAPSTYTPMLAITHPTACPTTFPFGNYLNIWCVPSIGGGNVIGYGTFPWLGAGIDGVVMDIDAVGNNSYPTNFPLIGQLDKGSVLTHELGHYLGLYHTFETMPNAGSAATCLGTAVSTGTTQGDMILDTPPTFINADMGTISSVNSCHENNFPYGAPLPDQNDQLENYMSYSDDDKLNTFTAGQTVRLIASFTFTGSPRFNLNTTGNLNGTGVLTNSCSVNSSILTGIFNYSLAPGSDCSTINVQFTNPLSVGFNTIGTTYSWNFGNGTGTGSNPLHAYSTSGGTIYLVSCTATNGTATATFTQNISLNFNASITGQSGLNMPVCRGTEQTVYISFGAGVPSVILTDGITQTVVPNSINFSGVVPYTFIASSSVSYSLMPATCGTVNLGSATFNVIDCCSSLITNGDFESGNSGFTTQLFFGPAVPSGSFYGTYTVTTPGPGAGTWMNWLSTQNVTGKAMIIDGFEGNNGIVPSPIINTSVTCTSTQTANYWKQTVTGLQPSTNYYYSFKVLENLNSQWYLACRHLQLATSITYSTSSFALTTQPVDASMHIPGGNLYNYVVYTYTFATPPTINTSTTFTVQINQINHFEGGYFDTFLDNITLNAMSPGIQALGSNTICLGQSTALTTTVNCGELLSNYNIAWTPTIGLSCNTCTNPIASPTTTTIYTLVATPTSTVGSPPAIFSTVTVNVKPTFTITPSSQIIYAGQSATITAGGSTGTYSWNPGALTGNSVVVTPSTTTIYTVTNAASGTCTANNTSTVTVSAACSQTASALFKEVNFPASTTIYTVANTVYDMEGTITFTANTSFTGYTLRMAPGTKLVISNSVTVTFNNCRLFGCTELWYGIQVMGITEWVSGLNVTNGTTIEDMYFGIHRDAAGTFGNQSFITITDSKLNKNYIGVQLLNLPSYNPAGSTYSLTVKNSTLTTASSTTSPGHNLKPSTISTYTYAYNKIAGGASGSTSSYTAFPRSHIGINLNNLSTTNNVVIGDSTGTANATYNTFSNMDFGIVSKNAQLRVHNNYFYNLKGSPKYYIMGDIFNPNPTPIGPDEIGIAVVAQHTVANTYSVQVGTRNGPTSMAPVLIYPKSNIFKRINKGISAKNCSEVIIKCNWFEADTTDEPASDYTMPGSSNTYEYYKAQTAVWSSALSKSATLSFNYIRNYRNGIFSSHTMSVSTGSGISCKSNNVQAQYATGYCRSAINFEQVGGANIPANALEISTNTIIKVYSGISGKNVLAGLYVYNNNNLLIDNIKTRGKGISYSYNHYGIYMIGVQNARIEKNLNVNGTNTLTVSNYSLTTGFFMQNSPSCTVTCNSTNNTGRGFSYVGNNLSPNGWLGNAMSNCYNGYELRTNGVIGAQGTNASGTYTLAANTWSNVTQETYVLNSPTSNTVSYMYVAANAGSPKTSPTLNFGTAGHTYSVGPGDGIREVSGTPFSCGGGGGGGFEGLMVGGTSTDEAESTGLMAGTSSTTLAGSENTVYKSLASSSTSDYELYPEEFTFQNQQMVYKLQKHGTVSTSADPALQSFYAGNQTSNIGKFVDVADYLANGQKALAISNNNSIYPANTVQQKTKTVNELMLKLNADPNYSFSSSEIQDLYSIAGECSAKGWYVVQARNILNVICGQVLYYEDSCEDNNVKSRMANSEESKITIDKPVSLFTLFPNPNKGNMILSYVLADESEANMSIYDVTGKLVSSYKLGGKIGTVEINEDQLHNGIYFYRILVNEKIIKTDKIVIIK